MKNGWSAAPEQQVDRLAREEARREPRHGQPDDGANKNDRAGEEQRDAPEHRGTADRLMTDMKRIPSQPEQEHDADARQSLFEIEPLYEIEHSKCEQRAEGE